MQTMVARCNGLRSSMIISEMMKNILCPIDHSPSSLQAFDHAIALARWQGARLHLLEVVEVAVPLGLSRAPKRNGPPTETVKALEAELKRVLVARHTSDLKIEILTREGNVVQEILAAVKTSRADLVVIGSHGHEGVQRLVIGSVAEKVLCLATCPVLTVRHGVTQTPLNWPPSATILCPTDFSAAANKAVAYASRLAKEADAKLILMNAVEGPFGDAMTSGSMAEIRNTMESKARDKLGRVLPRPGSDGPRAEALVAIGRASAQIVAIAHARSADLIVMGVSECDSSDVALPESTTHHVIQQGVWPVLTVRGVSR